MFTFLSSLRRSSRPARARTSSDLGKRRQRPEIEALEARDTPSTVFIDQAHVLHLVGDNGNNTYTLDHVSAPVITPIRILQNIPSVTIGPGGQSSTVLGGYYIADYVQRGGDRHGLWQRRDQH
jgi:hypothetical protein